MIQIPDRNNTVRRIVLFYNEICDSKTIFFIGVLLLFAACTPFSRQNLREVNTAENFEIIKKDPDRFLNKTVLWGGVMISTDVYPDGSYIKVLENKLNSETRPENLDMSSGRFIAYNSGFLDPAIYKEGREITIIGEIKGKETFTLPSGI